MKFKFLKFTVVGIVISLSAGGNASILYDSGPLEFSTTDQSMWATGDAFVKEESIFLGAEWTDKTAILGGIAGSSNGIITPEIPSVMITPAVPSVMITPAAPSVQITPAIPAVIVAGVTITPYVPAVYSPYIPAVYSPYIPAVYSPYIPAITGDTRTGAQLDVHSSGKVGLEFGYTVNSGSVDAEVDFNALAWLPEQPQEVGVSIDLNSSSALNGGSIQTQSPEIEAYISAIMQLSGSVDATACLITLGCTDGSADLPTIDMDQRILSIDPNSIKILDGILPGDEPLAEIPLANQSITLSGGLTTTAPPAPVFEVSTSIPGVEFSSAPGIPAVTTDLAEITVNVPNIATDGELDNGQITSAGRDDLLELQLDLDGLAVVATSGSLPPAGVTLDFVAGEVHIDIIDVDMGPTLGLTQDFELFPTLMTTVEFSNSILINGIAGLQDSWTGAWADLPDFSLFDTTVFSPTYWVDVILENDFGLDLGLSGTLDVLKIQADLGPLTIGPISLNSLLGLPNSLFETDKIGFSVAKDQFRLSGFNQIAGNSFTIDVLNGQTPFADNPTSVPEPSTLWLIALGLIPIIFTKRRSRQLTTMEA